MEFLKKQFNFNDFDFFAEQINQGDIKHSQLAKGDFAGQLTQLVHGPVIVSTHRMNQIILQEGTGKVGYTTFLIPGNMYQDFNWRKQRLAGNRIGILKEGMEHFGVTLSNLFATPVSIKNDYLFELLSKPGFESTKRLINSVEVIEIDKFNAELIHRMVIGICNAIEPDLELMTIDLPHLILDSIKDTAENSLMYSPGSRDLVFIKAAKYINQHLNQIINIQDICKVTGMSERSLRYIFIDKTGLAPKKFTQNLKLNKIRHTIKSNGSKNNIGKIASQYGFWHSGQFAADYKSLFGELPSEHIEK